MFQGFFCGLEAGLTLNHPKAAMKKRLGLSSALLVGFVLTMANYSFFSALLAFFVTSSRLTRWGAAKKKKIDADYKEGEAAPQ